MTDVVDLANRRPPVVYTVTVCHHWNGQIEAKVEGVSDDPRSQESVADAFAKVAALYMRGEHINTVLLARIDKLMDAKSGTPEAAELSALADACRAIEQWLVPT
jgi:hypothetical protein